MEAFARKIGVSKNTYQHYEYATRKPSLSFIIKLNHALGVSSDWLLGLDDSNPTPPIQATGGAAVALQSPGAKVTAKAAPLEYYQSIDTMVIIRAQQEIIDQQKQQIADLKSQLKSTARNHKK